MGGDQPAPAVPRRRPGEPRWSPRQRLALTGQRPAEPHNLVLQLKTDRPRIATRSSRSRRERRLGLGLRAAHQLLHSDARHPIVPGHLPLATPLNNDGGDHEPGQRHGAPPRLKMCQLCPETPANYVVQPVTSGRASLTAAAVDPDNPSHDAPGRVGQQKRDGRRQCPDDAGHASQKGQGIGRRVVNGSG